MSAFGIPGQSSGQEQGQILSFHECPSDPETLLLNRALPPASTHTEAPTRGQKMGVAGRCGGWREHWQDGQARPGTSLPFPPSLGSAGPAHSPMLPARENPSQFQKKRAPQTQRAPFPPSSDHGSFPCILSLACHQLSALSSCHCDSLGRGDKGSVDSRTTTPVTETGERVAVGGTVLLLQELCLG